MFLRTAKRYLNLSCRKKVINNGIKIAIVVKTLKFEIEKFKAEFVEFDHM
jgi:hypothetical protein